MDGIEAKNRESKTLLRVIKNTCRDNLKLSKNYEKWGNLVQMIWKQKLVKILNQEIGSCKRDHDKSRALGYH